MKLLAIFALICAFALIVSAVDKDEKTELTNIETGLSGGVSPLC
jgi:hypothetical protein